MTTPESSRESGHRFRSSQYLRTDDGAPWPELNAATERTLVESTLAASHAVACRLGELELRHLKLAIKLQRWRRRVSGA